MKTPPAAQGQSSLEYAVLITAVVLALAGLRIYMLRAVEGRLNESRWSILGGASPHYPERVQPGDFVYTLSSSENSTMDFVPNNTVNLGVGGRRRDARFTLESHFEECQARNDGCPPAL